MNRSDSTKRVRSVIRKGQRKPYMKATRKEIEQRVEGVALLHFCGFTKCQIHDIFRLRYKVEWRQVDRYMASAHAKEKGPLTSV